MSVFNPRKWHFQMAYIALDRKKCIIPSIVVANKAIALVSITIA